MTKSRITHLGVAAVLIVATVALVSCHGAGTLPAGEAYLTVYNPNTSTTNSENFYSQIFIDNKAVTPTIIYAGGQQNYAVTAPATHQLSFIFTATTGTAPRTITLPTLSIPAQGCTYTGPKTTATTDLGSGC